MPLAIPWRKAILLLAVLALLLLSSLGFAYLGMSSMSGQTGNCPFMPGHSAVCKMNPLEHIAAWQNMFAAIPSEKTFVLSLILLLALLLIRALVLKITWDFKFLRSSVQPIWHGRNPFIPRYALQEAFSNGIIHSKVF